MLETLIGDVDGFGNGFSAGYFVEVERAFPILTG
jgi:hypothetical protein